jgi:hypothetical protein
MGVIMKIGYEEIQLILKLENQKGLDENTCFDGISFIEGNDDDWSVEVFVEPVGNIKIRGKTLKTVLEFWLELFRTQPKDWGFAKAGGHIEKHLHLNPYKWELPEDARKVWTLTTPNSD